MTDELQELEPLEPIVETQAAPEAPSAPMPAPMAPMPGATVGLAAPAYNRGADKQYYRFLMAGVVMLIGCFMPFGPEWDMAGYKTLGGAFCTFVAVGMVWSWWGAISTNRFSGANLKWVGLAMIPLILQGMNLMNAFDAPAVKAFIAESRPMPSDWSDFFSQFFDIKNPDAQAKADNFVRAVGAGKFVVFVGALLAEVFMVLGVFGGAKTAKAQKAAGAAAAKPRRR